jgi:hypothetical protein
MYDTSTGTKKQIVLAVANDTLGFVPSDTAVVTLNFVTEQQSAKDYRQYTYRRSNSFTIVNGIEDNQAKKVLRYNISGGSADQVDVYVNGVKRERGTAADQYQLYDGVGSVVPPNSVLFNTTITGGSTQVDVVVSKAAAVSTASLNFVRAIDDEARVNTGAWEGVHSVNSPAHGGLYSLFVCDFSENHALALDVKLRVDPQIPSIVVDVPGGSPFIITNAAILLSRAKSFTQIDRQRAKWVPLTKLNSETEYMVVKLVDNARALFITEASTVNLFPVIEAVRFGSPKLQTQNLLGDPDAAELDNDLISGPDA